MFTLFLTGFVNTFLHYTLTFNTDIDRFVFMFLLIDLLIASVACIIREIEKYYNITKNILDQYNNQLAKRDEILTGIRKGFVFQKLRSSYYGIVYFKLIKAYSQIEKIQQDLINIGVSQDIAKNQNKLVQFLQEFGQDKYQLRINEQQKKFIFIKKDEK